MFTHRHLISFIIKSILIAGGVALLAMFSIVYVHGHIKRITHSIVEQKRLSAILEVRNQQFTQEKTNLGYVEERIDKISHALLPANNILEFVDALESIAAKNNLASTVRFDSPVATTKTFGDPVKTIYSVNFSLSLQANIFSLQSYTHDLEHLPYFAKIESLSFDSQGTGGWNNTSTVSIKGTLYTLEDK
jgi:hypothetical protein